MAQRAAPSVKRLLREAKQMSEQYEKDGDVQAAPLGDGDNLFDWHFTIRGPSDSPFEDGIYHGRLLFPPQYPMKPPEIFLLTPNGRFETNKKICLSISGYHPETWLPSWSVSTALRALQAFFCTPAKGAIGGLEWPEPERRRIAKKSPEWCCSACGEMKSILDQRIKDADVKTTPTAASVDKTSDNAAVSARVESARTSSDENNNNVETNKTENSTSSNAGSKTPNEASEKQSSSKTSALEERRRLEQTMMRNQIQYQQSDMWSILCMAFLAVCIGLLAMRKMNQSSDPHLN